MTTYRIDFSDTSTPYEYKPRGSRDIEATDNSDAMRQAAELLVGTGDDRADVYVSHDMGWLGGVMLTDALKAVATR